MKSHSGLVVSGLFALAAAVPAQTPLHGPLPVRNQPFTAQRTFSSFVKLADGTTIEKSSVSDEARDSAGRTWWHTTRIMHGKTIENWLVRDPANSTNISWCSCTRVVHVNHFGLPDLMMSGASESVSSGVHGSSTGTAAKGSSIEGPATGGSSTGAGHSPSSAAVFAGGEAASDPDVAYLGPAGHRSKYQLEKLPPQTIFGLPTNGTRATRTVQAGAEGNSRELTTTTQSWYSPDLQLALVTIVDDPVRGLSKREYKELRREEPSPAIFIPPVEYRVVESGSKVAEAGRPE